MDKQRTKQAIQDLFKDNLNLYPEDYPLEMVNGEYLASNEASEMASDVAESYWEHRQEHEVERDEKNNVELIDYVEWCLAELTCWIEDKNEGIEA